MNFQKISKNLQAIVKAHPFVSATIVLSAALFLLFVWIEIKAELLTSKTPAPTYDLAMIQLREQQEREESVLNTYKLMDAERGVVQIPIEYAMILIAEERQSADLIAKVKSR